jgi:hypothetical protein
MGGRGTRGGAAASAAQGRRRVGRLPAAPQLAAAARPQPTCKAHSAATGPLGHPPKFLPTMQCHVGLCFTSNSFLM